MKEAKVNQVNRCFGNCPKNLKKGSKSKNLQLTMQQREEREEKVKRILFAAAEERRVNAQKRKENNVLSRLLLEYKGRYSILQLLPLIKRRYPPLLAVAVERVEAQKQRGELSMDKVLDFERFKASLKKEE